MGSLPPRRLPLHTKLLYGVGDIGVALSATAIGTYLLFFYTDVVGLGVGLAGLVSGIARLWDAIVDPPMGYLSDKTRTRFGRRRFWFGLAAIPLGLCVFLLFSPPVGLGQEGLFAWMLVGYLGTYLFLTMFWTPYYALGAELSDDPDERTQIVAVRQMFQYVGAVAGGFMPVLALQLGQPRQGYSVVAAAFGLLAAGAILLAFFGTREREALPAPAASFKNFWGGMRGSLTNRPFRILLFTFLMLSIGGGINGAVSVYALVYWLGFTMSEIGLLVPSILGAAVLSLPLWTRLSARIGKDRAFMTLCLYLAFVFALLWFLPPSKPVIWAALTIQGIGVAGFVVSSSLLADVLDHDELTSGEQRGGAFFGFWTFATKFGAGVGPPVVGGVLWLAGYVPGQTQTEQGIDAIRLLYGPIPALFCLGAASIFHRFPLTRAAHREIHAEVHRRRAMLAAEMPALQNPMTHLPSQELP
jgi:sugar (glycoside-pentoside-hexuronide) transporter